MVMPSRIISLPKETPLFRWMARRSSRGSSPGKLREGCVMQTHITECTNVILEEHFIRSFRLKIKGPVFSLARPVGQNWGAAGKPLFLTVALSHGTSWNKWWNLPQRGNWSTCAGGLGRESMVVR